jgi:hypothetical protein
MALVQELKQIDKDRNNVHQPGDCSYTVVSEG